MIAFFRWLKMARIRKSEARAWAAMEGDLGAINRMAESGCAETPDDVLILRAALYLVASTIYRRKAQRIQ